MGEHRKGPTTTEQHTSAQGPGRGNLPGVVTALAELPPDSQLDAKALGILFGRCKKSIQRAVRRGELPPPFRFMGKHVWLAETIVLHMKARQEAAVKTAARRTIKLSEHAP